MKETKVYVDEMPNSCSKCEWCTLNHKDNYGRSFCLISRMPLYNGDKVNEERGQYKDSLSDFNCPLIDIKTHDRELARQVCEKIIHSAYNVLYEEGEFDISDTECVVQDIKDEFRFSWTNKQASKWQKLKEWLEDIKNPISVSENFNYRQIELIDNILLKMQELEGEDD